MKKRIKWFLLSITSMPLLVGIVIIIFSIVLSVPIIALFNPDIFIKKEEQ